MNHGPVEILEGGLSGAGHKVVGFIEAGPSPQRVAEMLGCLDGDDVDQLYLEVESHNGRAEIAVLGDSEGLAVLFIMEPDETHYLTDPRRDEGADNDEVTQIASGGADIDVLCRWLLPIDACSRGLWFYLLTGELDPGLAWEPFSEVPEETWR